MPVNELTIAPASLDTTRRPSAGLWQDCPWDALISNPGMGIGIFDDFETIPSISTAAAIGTVGRWAAWLASGQTILDGVEEGGVAKFDGTTTAKSTILTSNAGSIRIVGPTAAFALLGGRFWGEMRIALGSVASSQQGVFFGLADHTSSQINSGDTTIMASGGNTLTNTKNLIGVFNRTTTSPADFSAVFQPAGGSAVFPTSLTTLVNTVTGANMAAYAASTPKGQGTGFVKIGFKINLSTQLPFKAAPASPPSGQTQGTLYRPSIQFFVNGVAAPAFLSPNIIQAATFPNNCLFSPVFNYINIAGATAPVYVDWLRFAYEGTF